MATIIRKQTIEREIEKEFADAKLIGRVSTDIQNNIVSFSGTIHTGEGYSEAVGNYNFSVTPYYTGNEAEFDEAKYAAYAKELMLEIETQIKLQ